MSKWYMCRFKVGFKGLPPFGSECPQLPNRSQPTDLPSPAFQDSVGPWQEAVVRRSNMKCITPQEDREIIGVTIDIAWIDILQFAIRPVANSCTPPGCA